jgi:hypothetical protein
MDRPEQEPEARRKGGEEPGPGEQQGGSSRLRVQGPAYGRYVALLAVVILVLITVNTIVTKPNGDTGIAPGATVPPFAVPLAGSDLSGDADVATRAHEGAAGEVPACRERGPKILNVCQLYEQGPVVLALFVDGGSCPKVLSAMQSLSGRYRKVRFAAVAIKGDRAGVRKLIRSRRLTFPVGLDRDGALAALYKVATCPQVSFIERGGAVQSRALLGGPTPAQLRARVAELAATGAPVGSATG